MRTSNNDFLTAIRERLKKALNTENVYLLSNASEIKPYYIIRNLELRDSDPIEAELYIECVIDSNEEAGEKAKADDKAIKEAFEEPVEINGAIAFLNVQKQEESESTEDYEWSTYVIDGTIVE